MKRAGNLFEKITSDANLRIAAYLAARGKGQREECRRFTRSLDANLIKLSEELKSAQYVAGDFLQFVIHDPKRRIISAPSFRDRVVHHAVMRVCEPVFERWLIDDTYACRVGRGRDRAVRRAAGFARQYDFFLKLDIRSYFDSISHNRLVERLECLFKDRRLLDLFDAMIRSFRTAQGSGLPIGSLMSQHFANFYLGWFDRQVKEQWRIPGYVRYMDDMTLWSNSKCELINAIARSNRFLRESLGLELNQSIQLNRSRHGVDFLGCRVRSEGVMLSRRSRVRLGRKIRNAKKQFESGLIDELTLQRRLEAILAFARSANAASAQYRRNLLQLSSVNDH